MTDSKYVNLEMYIPDTYAFLDANPSYAIILHKTASPSMGTAQEIAAYFQSGSDGREVSSHYIIGKDGLVVQAVREKDGAGANAGIPMEVGRNPLFAENINWNLRTISIEHVDTSNDNSQPLTSAQQHSSFLLIRDICQRKHIPYTHIAQHKDIQPISKPKCAGNYPMDELLSFLHEGQMGIKLNKNGEVCDIVSATQFIANKTEYACGFFVAALIRYAGKPDSGVTAKETDVQTWALEQYTKEYGADGANKIGGVSIDDMHRLLNAALPNSGTSHYYDLPISPTSTQTNDMLNIIGALSSGYPVAVTVKESSIIDKELGINPYFWGASGNHVILITGIDANNDLICHDTANVVGDLQGLNTARSQPRHYDHNTIDCSWASMCRMEWLEVFPSGWNPITGIALNQIGINDIMGSPLNTTNKVAMNNFIISIWAGKQPVIGSANIPVRDTAIFNNWRDLTIKGECPGCPETHEQDVTDENGDACLLQVFGGKICIYRKKDGMIRWL